MTSVTRFSGGIVMKFASLLLTIVLGLLLTGCTYNPATGRNQLLMMSSEEEIALANEAMPQLIEEYGGQVPSPQLTAYVREIGYSMTPHVEDQYKDLPWEFTVLDSEVINAFALPGGKVFISRGLLDRLSNEAEVAGVLGHEIGHVTSQHADERISQAMVVQGIAIGATVAAGESDSEWAAVVPIVVGVGGQGYLLTFSRSQESESDRQGLKYMTRAGYSPEGLLGVLQVLIEASQGSTTPEFLSTHPDPERRLRDARARIEKEYAAMMNNPAYGLYEQRFQEQAVPELQRLRNRN
jgi:predicted Zn-dependent protease